MNDFSQPVSLPRLNEPAPDFRADTTQGMRSLQDYAGRWLVLFSHPADFTPVCTSEFIAFAQAHGEFDRIHCSLLGLSIDSKYAHIAWIRNIAEKFNVDIPFPVIEDLSMRVASSYGMIHPGASDTSAVRSTFVIDPDGILRAMLYYPMTSGRSIREIYRLVTALQTSAEHKVSTPAGWTQGDPVFVPPPETTEDAEARASDDYDYTDWYFAKRSMPPTWDLSHA